MGGTVRERRGCQWWESVPSSDSPCSVSAVFLQTWLAGLSTVSGGVSGPGQTSWCEYVIVSTVEPRSVLLFFVAVASGVPDKANRKSVGSSSGCLCSAAYIWLDFPWLGETYCRSVRDCFERLEQRGCCVGGVRGCQRRLPVAFKGWVAVQSRRFPNSAVYDGSPFQSCGPQ